MKLLGRDLDDYQHEQGRQKNSRSSQVAQIPGHGDSVATRLTKRRRKNLDDPKTECDLGNFAGVMLNAVCHLISLLTMRYLAIQCDDYKFRRSSSYQRPSVSVGRWCFVCPVMNRCASVLLETSWRMSLLQPTGMGQSRRLCLSRHRRAHQRLNLSLTRDFDFPAATCLRSDSLMRVSQSSNSTAI